jgi:uncharacterized protein
MTAVELRSRAVVETSRPTPYLKQLAKHFGHKLDVSYDDERGVLPFAFGRAELRADADAGVLVIEAIAQTPEALERVEQVTGSHLERFGRRDELLVRWSPA